MRRALLSMLVLAAVLPGTASAHESHYCEHSEVKGKHWMLNYYSYENQRGDYNGTSGTYHFHSVNHNYRQTAGSGTYYYYHRYWSTPYCDWKAGSPSRTTLVPVPPTANQAPTDVPQVGPDLGVGNAVHDVTGTVTQTQSQTIHCTGYTVNSIIGGTKPTSCWAFILPAGRAAPAHEQLSAIAPVTVVAVRPARRLGGQQLYASTEIAAPVPDQCVLGIAGLDAQRIDSVDDFRRGLRMEVADPALAKRLGHSCV